MSDHVPKAEDLIDAAIQLNCAGPAPTDGMTRLLLALALAGCAITQTPASIARQLDMDLRFAEARRQPIRLRCESVLLAQRSCLAIGQAPDCAWTNDRDEDHDSFTIRACQDRQRRGMEAMP